MLKAFGLKENKMPSKAGNLLLGLFCFAVLLVCVATPLGNALNAPSAYFYDDFSDNLIKADIVYIRAYGLDGPFARYLQPGQEYSGGIQFVNAQQITEFLESGQVLPAEEFSYYTSNLCIQRYGYALLALLPLPPAVLFVVLKFINQLLFALALAGVLVWVKQYSNTATTLLVLAVLAFLSPILTNFSGHLYWAPYTWFVPLLGAAWVVANKAKAKTEKRWHKNLFFTAFATCLFKQLFCFEFVSGVMVAMILPVLGWLLQNVRLKEFKRWVQTLFWPFLGAVASFVVAMGAKVVVLALAPYPGKGEEGILAAIVNNILQRTGGVQYAQQLAAQGYNTSLGGVLHAMFSEGAVVLRSRLRIGFYAVLALLFFFTVVALLLRKKMPGAKSMGSLFVLAWVSFIAPMFWFVVGKLHVVDHIRIDLVAWYIPFAIVAYAAMAYWVTGLVRWGIGCLRGKQASKGEKA